MQPTRAAFAALLFLAVPTSDPVFASPPSARTAAANPVYDSFPARAVRVKDGDSVIVRRRNGRLSEIRLAGIDAPELSQPGGRDAKAALKRLLNGREIRVDVTDRDRYNRLVAMLWTGQTFVNAEMARSGHAWAFARYLPDPRIRAAHDEARAAKRGLWSLPESEQVPPATWRMTHPYRPDSKTSFQKREKMQ